MCVNCCNVTEICQVQPPHIIPHTVHTTLLGAEPSQFCELWIGSIVHAIPLTIPPKACPRATSTVTLIKPWRDRSAYPFVSLVRLTESPFRAQELLAKLAYRCDPRGGTFWGDGDTDQGDPVHAPFTV